MVLRLTPSLRAAGRSRAPAAHAAGGAQASSEQLEKILSCFDIGRQEGAKVLIADERNTLGGEFKDGYYVKPTVFFGHNKLLAEEAGLLLRPRPAGGRCGGSAGKPRKPAAVPALYTVAQADSGKQKFMANCA